MGPIGMPEMIIVFIVILLLFGAKKLPELARGIGKSMGEFKKAKDEFEKELHSAQEEAERPQIQAPQEKRQPVASVQDS